MSFDEEDRPPPRRWRRHGYQLMPSLREDRPPGDKPDHRDVRYCMEAIAAAGPPPTRVARGTTAPSRRKRKRRFTWGALRRAGSSGGFTYRGRWSPQIGPAAPRSTRITTRKAAL